MIDTPQEQSSIKTKKSVLFTKFKRLQELPQRMNTRPAETVKQNAKSYDNHPMTLPLYIPVLDNDMT
jgi:hypothetical protein